MTLALFLAITDVWLVNQVQHIFVNSELVLIMA